MSKASKSRRALERRKQIRAAKEAQRARYEGYKASGSNRKSKRSKLSAKRAKPVRLVRHAGPCNNFGCDVCFEKQSQKPEYPKAHKPWKTSSEKLAHYNKKLASERGETSLDLSKEEIEMRIVRLDERLGGQGIGASKERARLARMLKAAA